MRTQAKADREQGMSYLKKGRFVARFAGSDQDMRRAQQLRYLAFRAGAGPGDSRAQPVPQGRDADAFDPECRHVLIEQAENGQLVCCFRLMLLPDGRQISRSYSAQFYDLSALRDYRGRMVEMGRFCIHPAWTSDPDILRVAWGAMARMVDEEGIEMFFGCCSFAGTEADTYADAFAMLAQRHLAPRRWWPRIKAPRVFPFAHRLGGRTPDARRALLGMPALLRSYLLLGGWVSDHAVVDRDLGTLHVFTGLEIAAIPPARQKLLRATAMA